MKKFNLTKDSLLDTFNILDQMEEESSLWVKKDPHTAWGKITSTSYQVIDKTRDEQIRSFLIRGNTIKIPGQVVGIVVQDLKPQDNKCILIVIEPLSSSLREEWDPEIPMLYSLNIYEWDKLKCEVVK